MLSLCFPPAWELQRLRVEDDAVIEVTLYDPSTGAESLLLVEGTWSRYAPSGKGTLVRVEGTRGEIEVSGSGFGAEEDVVVRTRFQGERSQHVVCRLGRSLMDESFLHELRNFVVCVAEGRQPTVTYDIGLQVMACLGAGYLSELRGRQALTLGQFGDFCREFEEGRPKDHIADDIIRALMAPYA